jgi:hypothetical protein
VAFIVIRIKTCLDTNLKDIKILSREARGLRKLPISEVFKIARLLVPNNINPLIEVEFK